MPGPLRTSCWKLYLSLCALLLSVAATTAQAVEAPAVAAEPPVEELVELSEVWVRGKKLARRVANAEDRLFKAYNKINKNNIYDVHCGSLRLQTDSMIMTRTCLPGYLSDINYVSYSPSYMYSRSALNTCDTTFGLHYSSGCSFSGIPAGSGSFNSPIVVRARSSSAAAAESDLASVPPSVLSGYRREAYAQNVLDVITSDEDLTAMATELVKLYDEMNLVRNRYTSMRQATAPDGEKVRRYRGKSPRN
jgi:hypothetical protein